MWNCTETENIILLVQTADADRSQKENKYNFKICINDLQITYRNSLCTFFEHVDY